MTSPIASLAAVILVAALVLTLMMQAAVAPTLDACDEALLVEQDCKDAPEQKWTAFNQAFGLSRD